MFNDPVFSNEGWVIRQTLTPAETPLLNWSLVPPPQSVSAFRTSQLVHCLHETTRVYISFTLYWCVWFQREISWTHNINQQFSRGFVWTRHGTRSRTKPAIRTHPYENPWLRSGSCRTFDLDSGPALRSAVTVLGHTRIHAFITPWCILDGQYGHTPYIWGPDPVWNRTSWWGRTDTIIIIIMIIIIIVFMLLWHSNNQSIGSSEGPNVGPRGAPMFDIKKSFRRHL